jgi:hypothetical protein
MNSATELSDSYVTVWNEGDPERRRAMVAELWAPDGEHVLVPPQEVREAAAEMKMASVFEVRGHRELEVRVTDAYERFVAAGEYHFRRREDAERLRDVVKFIWEMVSSEDGSVIGIGIEIPGDRRRGPDPKRLPIHRELSRDESRAGERAAPVRPATPLTSASADRLRWRRCS